MLRHELTALLRPGDALLTTWSYDATPTTKPPRAPAPARPPLGARLLETPVWGSHWNAPGDSPMPLARASKLSLPADSLARKRAAMACFNSQLRPDGDAAPVLTEAAVDRLLTAFELFFHAPDAR